MTFNYSGRFKILEGILVLASGSLAVYAFLALQSEYKDPQHFQMAKKQPRVAATVRWEDSLKITQPFETYSKQFEARDIFSEAVAKTEVTSEAASGSSAPQAPSNHFKVAGILLDKSPEAVIVDTSLNQTYFLKEGQQQGEMIVKKIEKGKVLIEYMGQPFELKTQSQ